MFYRLIIQNNPDGNLSGAAAYDTPTSDARPITTEDLKDFMPDVNAAALGQKEALETTHAEALAQLTKAHTAALAEKDAALATLTTERDAIAARVAELEPLLVELTELKKPEIQKKREQLEAIKAQADAELAKLEV